MVQLFRNAAPAVHSHGCPCVIVHGAEARGCPLDYGGVTVFSWIIFIAMSAATVPLFAETGTAAGHWKIFLHVGGLVTLVAGVHYMCMRQDRLQVHISSVAHHCID